MTACVALLRAVNVGGTGKLTMAELKSLCEAIGFAAVRTYIASGNVVFQTAMNAAEAAAALEARLHSYAGKPVGVLVRDAAAMAAIVAGNPFPEAPGNRVAVIFLDAPATAAMLDAATGRADDEALRLGRREIYVRYGAAGMGRSKLHIPAAKSGTARNINTVAALAAMVAG
jgi:uncharacterized protein (DUF1697 family)